MGGRTSQRCSYGLQLESSSDQPRFKRYVRDIDIKYAVEGHLMVLELNLFCFFQVHYLQAT